MKNRILIPVLLALGTIVLCFVWTEDSADPNFEDLQGAARVSASERSPAAALPESSVVEASVERRELATEASSEPVGRLQPGDAEELDGARPDGSVLIEVHLDLGQATFVGGTHPYAGSSVHIQAWDQETDETVAHQFL